MLSYCLKYTKKYRKEKSEGCKIKKGKPMLLSKHKAYL